MFSKYLLHSSPIFNSKTFPINYYLFLNNITKFVSYETYIKVPFKNRPVNTRAQTTSQIIICIAIVIAVGAVIYLAINYQESPPATRENIIIVDSAGRRVTVPQPLENVVLLTSDAGEAIQILGAQEKVVGVTKYIPDSPGLFPKMGNKPVVGSWWSPNYEEIAEIGPQVVVAYTRWPGEELEKNLEPFGIKVVRLDFYKPKGFDNELKIFAKILGKTEKTENFLEWKRNIQNFIEERLESLEVENKIRVYAFSPTSTELDPWVTFSQRSSTHQGIVEAGGINVASEFRVSYPPVSPEWLLIEKPEAIIVSVNVEVGAAGYDMENNTALKQLREEVRNHDVFKKTNAVKNNRVYLIYSKLLGGARTFIGTSYLTKWFYPSRFENLNPKTIHEEYFEEWLDIKFQGTYAYPEP